MEDHMPRTPLAVLRDPTNGRIVSRVNEDILRGIADWADQDALARLVRVSKPITNYARRRLYTNLVIPQPTEQELVDKTRHKPVVPRDLGSVVLGFRVFCNEFYASNDCHRSKTKRLVLENSFWKNLWPSHDRMSAEPLVAKYLRSLNELYVYSSDRHEVELSRDTDCTLDSVLATLADMKNLDRLQLWGYTVGHPLPLLTSPPPGIPVIPDNVKTLELLEFCLGSARDGVLWSLPKPPTNLERLKVITSTDSEYHPRYFTSTTVEQVLNLTQLRELVLHGNWASDLGFHRLLTLPSLTLISAETLSLDNVNAGQRGNSADLNIFFDSRHLSLRVIQIVVRTRKDDNQSATEKIPSLFAIGAGHVRDLWPNLRSLKVTFIHGNDDCPVGDVWSSTTSESGYYVNAPRKTRSEMESGRIVRSRNYEWSKIASPRNFD